LSLSLFFVNATSQSVPTDRVGKREDGIGYFAFLKPQNWKPRVFFFKTFVLF
jgi:hypothetical protein